MEDARALQEWLAGAGLAGFEAALAQFGVATVQDLAESNHDDVYLRFNVRVLRTRDGAGTDKASEGAKFARGTRHPHSPGAVDSFLLVTEIRATGFCFLGGFFFLF
jgi:hypothetical protein